MGRIYKRKEQANGDGICSAANRCARYPRNFGARRRKQDSAIGIQPFAQPKAPRLRNERLRFLEQQIVKLRARLPPYFENIFEACGCHQDNSSASSLKKCVRPNRGPANKFEAARIRKKFPDSSQCMSDRVGRFPGRGRNLQNFNASAAKKNTIRERAAGIKRDAHEIRDCTASWQFAAESYGLGQFPSRTWASWHPI